MGALVFFAIVGGGVIGAIAYFKYRARQARVAAVNALAARIGFTFTADDVDRTVDLPFGLFGRGAGRRVELVVSGKHNDCPLRLFDYWYYDETTDAHGMTTRSYHRFTCGLLTLPMATPHLRLGHEGFFSKIGSHLGLRDIELEYDAFNQRFRVQCSDQKFAFCLLDGQMMEWLLSDDQFATVEIVGPWILLAVNQLEPEYWLNIGNWLEKFHGRVPKVVYTEYPPGA